MSALAEIDQHAGLSPRTHSAATRGDLRILMLAQFYWPIIGGEEQVVQDLSRELAGRGHSVAVATQWHAGLPEFELDGTVRVYRLRSLAARANWLFRESGRRHAPPWPDPGTTLGLRQVIRHERPQIVHAHNWLVYSFLPLKKMSGARLVVTLHDYSLLCAKKRLMFAGQPCSGPRLSKCLACASEHYGLVKGPATVVATGLSGQWERAAEYDAAVVVPRVEQAYRSLTRLQYDDAD